MKRGVFTYQGKFPFTQDTFGYIQEAYLEILSANYSHLDSTLNYILSGVIKNEMDSVSDGWVLMAGELLRVRGGEGLYLSIVDDNNSVTFQNGDVNEVYLDRYLIKTTDSSSSIHVDEFLRLHGHSDVLYSDCNHLGDRTYEYQLPSFVASLFLDASGNDTNGFILNRINPFTGIRNGYELTIRMGHASGMTFMTKNGVDSNIRYMNWQFSRNGNITSSLRPVFGDSSFIGSNNNSIINTGVGYDNNVHMVLKWFSKESVWIETYRGSQATQSNSI